MPLLIGCFAVAFPRLALVLVWLFGDGYLQSAYSSLLWPLLGFLFLPLTTLTFAYATHSLAAGDGLSALGWLLVAIAALVDIGLVGRGGARYRRSREPA